MNMSKKELDMKKCKIFALAAALVAVLSVGTANAAPANHKFGHRYPSHVVTTVQPRHHNHHNIQHNHHNVHNHHHQMPRPPRPHQHHHHHHNVGNVILATAILVSALM